MVLGLQAVGLGAARRERSGNNDAGGLADAIGRGMVAPDDDAELIEQSRADDQAVVVIDLVFTVPHIDARLRKDKAAHPAVLFRGGVGVEANGGQVVLRELVRDGRGDFGVALRIGGRLLEQTLGSDGVDDRLQILFFPIDRNQERIFPAAAQRSQQAAFVDAPLFGRTGGGEGVACVQMIVAEQEIECSVVNLRAGLGDDLDASAAGARELGGVRILVDLHLLDGGCGHADISLLHTVDDQGDAAGADRSGIEKLGHGGDIILVEDGEVVHHAAVHGDDVQVVRRVGADLCGGIAYGDRLAHAGQLQLDVQRRGRPVLEGDGNGLAGEAVVLHVDLEGAGAQAGEAEIAQVVGSRIGLGGGGAPRADLHLGTGYSGAAGVADCPGNRIGARWNLGGSMGRQGSAQDNKTGEQPHPARRYQPNLKIG